MIALKIAIKSLNNNNDKEYGYYGKKNLTKHTKNTSHCYWLGGGEWGQPKDGLVTSTDNVGWGGGLMGAPQGRFSYFN